MELAWRQKSQTTEQHFRGNIEKNTDQIYILLNCLNLG